MSGVMLHHVQVSCPPGGEAEARSFWTALGFVEVPKPAALAGRGGCWFRSTDASGAVGAEIHVGVEESFVAARKAHPALVMEADAFEAVADRLAARGTQISWAERDTFEGYRRFHCTDPFGNRVEVLSPR